MLELFTELDVNAPAMEENALAGLVQDACRLCLEHSGSTPIHADTYSLAADIEQCAGVLVSPEDCLPDTICGVCMDALQMIKGFRRMAAQNDSRLRWIHQSNHSDKEGPHPFAVPKVLMETEDTVLDYGGTTATQTTASDSADPQTQLNNEAERAPQEHYGKISIRVDIFEDNGDKDRPTKELQNQKPMKHMKNDQSYQCGNSLSETVQPTSSSKQSKKIAKKRKNETHPQIYEDTESSAQDSSKLKKATKKRRKMENANSTTSFDIEKVQCSVSNVEHKDVKGTLDLKSSTKAEVHTKSEPTTAYTGSRRNSEFIAPEDLVCQICEKQFDRWKSFYHHVRLHNKSHHCPICEKSFSSKNDLSKHARIHTGEKPYKCSVCDKGFSQKGTLKIHEVNVHQSKYFN